MGWDDLPPDKKDTAWDSEPPSSPVLNTAPLSKEDQASAMHEAAHNAYNLDLKNAFKSNPYSSIVKANTLPFEAISTVGLGGLSKLINPKTNYLEQLKNLAKMQEVPTPEKQFENMGVDEAYPSEQKILYTGKGFPTTQKIPGVKTSTALGNLFDLATAVGPEKAASAMESGGKYIYSKAPLLKKWDKILIDDGKVPLSQILMENKKIPLTVSGLEDAAKDSLNTITKERNAIEAPILKSEITLPEAQYANDSFFLDKPKKFVNDLKNSGSAIEQDLAPKLQEFIDKQEAVSYRQPKELDQGKWGPTYKELLDVKRGASDLGQFSSSPNTQGNFFRTMAGDARDQSYKIANEFERRANPNMVGPPATAQNIHNLNQRVSSILSILPDAERKAIVEAGKHNVTEIDAILALSHPDLYAYKQIGKVMKQPAPFTVTGSALMGAGKAGKKIAPPIQNSAWVNMINNLVK